MGRTLILHIRFHDGRYHGAGDWPPSPARLFQALVAGAAKSSFAAHDADALTWLETLAAPTIAAPRARESTGFRTFLPNNDLDSVGGDVRRIGQIRKAVKQVKPRLFDGEKPLLYVWRFEAGEESERNAQIVCAIAERLYQLGRGVDMAWAWGELGDERDAEEMLAAYDGAVYRPGKSGEGLELRTPHRGSLESLIVRHAAQAKRFARSGSGVTFTQAPKPSFATTDYGRPTRRLLFELRRDDAQSAFVTWPLKNAPTLVERVRDGAVEKLKKALPKLAAKIERVLIGRGAEEADKAQRIRIIPLPSIGHEHADHAIRRVLVEIPPNCPLPEGDLRWAFSGLDLADRETGEVLAVMLAADDRSMFGHYGVDVERGFRIWRTVTPVALPARLPHARMTGAHRRESQAEQASVVRQALGHAGVTLRVDAIRVQREPFTGGGKRADAFAQGTRFAVGRLAHVEIVFAPPVQGPMVIGDGRYLGLGLMAPVRDAFASALVFSIREQDRPPLSQRDEVLRAVRRALMSRDAQATGKPSGLFSGHETGNGPARSGDHRHVYLIADSADGTRIDRIGVVAPWRVDRSWQPRREERARFDDVARGLSIVRAGRVGVIHFEATVEASEHDPLFRAAPEWRSCTPYRPTRHAKKGSDANAVVASDLIAECSRRGLPRPEVVVTRLTAGPRGGAQADARLRFRVAVPGPILLGRDAHRGGGLFIGAG